ncbi:MAG TPA: molecular chaperone HtpG, partial [Spirochaetota bacterium]|nr:molecular chaperone HtpG [Spirochaetota bacterium]
NPRIDISFNAGGNKSLTIADTGIGMNAEDLTQNLGTIASSGTKKFLEKLTGDAKRDANLIGQFGVGFYSSFMVADRVEVISRKAGESNGYKWASDGKGEFEIEEVQKETEGTVVTLYLNKEGEEYTNRWEIQNIIKKYSNHIPFPIYLHYEDIKYEGEGDKRKETREQKTDQINAASAMWKRAKSSLKDEDYNEFYRSISHDVDDPLMHIHNHAEGRREYTTLFYIPQKAPFDLFRVDYVPGVKLYVKRVFITDDEKELMPVYLRFLRGVIDSEDLPLNVSREMLQQNQILAEIKSSSVKKVLGELENLQKKDREKYNTFFTEFGVPIKEGLYQDFENREKLLNLVMYKSTRADGFTTFEEYVSRMKPDQQAIYYITGEKEEILRNSPLLEMYQDKDIEVLIMDNEIDDIIISTVPKFKDFDLKSVNRSDSADDLKTEDDKKKEESAKPVIEKIKECLGDSVKDVKASVRLSGSPSCIVADEKDPTVQMQHLLKAMGQGNIPDFKPILEVNPDHPIVKKLTDIDDKNIISDISFLLLEQAMLVEGVELKNPVDFVARLNRVMEKAI